MALGSQVREVLGECEGRRLVFLRCSGMHTEAVFEVVKEICEGRMKSPALAFIAPALYEGIPETLEKVMGGLGDLAIYSSLYMGLVAVAGFSGFYPSATRNYILSLWNGVYSSMFMHTGVVAITVLYRLASIGQLRDSDKLLYLWRSRFVPLAAAVLFVWGAVSAIFALMYAVAETVGAGHACFAESDPTMNYQTWWRQWTGRINTPVGQGVYFPKGEKILNPWSLKAQELNITYQGRDSEYAAYNEFMTQHFGFTQPCDPQAAFEESYGPQGAKLANVFLAAYATVPLLVLVIMVLWVAPSRHIFNYWGADRRKSITHYALAFLGFVSFHCFGPLAFDKENDPFDMTEPWDEFKLRAEVGRILANKDDDGDGLVQLTEHDRRAKAVSDVSNVLDSSSPQPADEEEAVDEEFLFLADPRLREFLDGLRLAGIQDQLVAADIDFETLKAMAQDDASCCALELKNAGIVMAGHRLKIITALRRD